MRAKDIEVGQEVSVLVRGHRDDLARATVQHCTVIHEGRWSSEWWSSERWQAPPVRVAGPDGGQIEIRQARLDPQGNLVLVDWDGARRMPASGRCSIGELVPLSRILGPADEWGPRITAARDEHQRKLDERHARDEVLDNYADGLQDGLELAGVKALARRSGGVIEITMYDLASAERLGAILARAAESEEEA